jgi:hypothetical protein
MNKSIRYASIALLFAAGVAGAQAPAPVPASATDLPPMSIPKATCVKPGDAPGRNAGDMQRKGWQRDATAWQDCMRKYIDGIRAQGDFYTKAANSAVDDFNKVTNTWNDQLKAAKE